MKELLDSTYYARIGKVNIEVSGWALLIIGIGVLALVFK